MTIIYGGAGEVVYFKIKSLYTVLVCVCYIDHLLKGNWRLYVLDCFWVLNCIILCVYAKYHYDKA